MATINVTLPHNSREALLVEGAHAPPMSNVTPIRRKAPRPPDCNRALALLEEAGGLLDGLVESGQVEEGSPPDMTRWYLDDAIGMLTENEEEVHHD
jgi:hypothetical protein